MVLLYYDDPNLPSALLNGNNYDVGWKSDKQHGHGTYSKENGSIKIGFGLEHSA